MNRVSNLWLLLLAASIYLFANNVQAQTSDTINNNTFHQGKSQISAELKNTRDDSFNKSFAQQGDSKPFIQGFALGGMAFLSLILLFLYSATSSKNALLLSAYFMSRALFLAALFGGGLHHFLPQYFDIKVHDINTLELSLLTAASSLCLLWFSVYLFKLKTTALTLYHVIKWLGFALLAYIPISLQLNIDTNILISLSIHSFALFVLVIFGYLLIKQATRLAKLFTMVMLIQFVFSLINLFMTNNHGTNNFEDSTFLYSISFWLDGFLIIFLFSREYYYQIKRQQDAQEELLTLQQETQEQLEMRVQEHTLELHVALQELEDANRELTEKNTQDELTGLYNRRFYDQKILAEHRRSRRNLTPLSLIIIDIDHFKKVNDNFGHLAGDHCLTLVAKQLKLSLHRPSDIGCRYGGEEFCIILPETDTQGAFTLSETLRKAIEALTIEYENQIIPLTISCGISTYQQQSGILPDHIFAAADKALYLAKHQGRNQTQQANLQDELHREEKNSSSENINE